ncbi:MAG: polysaccharide deacetylase family protein, partial [Armatimonadota bacterium]
PGDPKFEYLLSEGFRVLLSVGPRPYEKATSGYVMADRRRIDGLAFRSQRSMLLDLFDSHEVIDSVRPR